MEVIEAKQLMLTNFEVLQLLQELRSRGDAGRPMAKSQSALATITYETVKYLEGMACSRLTEESLTAFMTDIEPFKLTKQDKIHLLNLRPTTAVEIQLVSSTCSMS